MTDYARHAARRKEIDSEIADPMTTNTLSIYQDDTDTVIARSPQDAMEVWEAQTGCDYHAETDEGPEAWTLYPHATLRIVHPDEDLPDEVHTPDEWIAKEGRCWLGSTEY